MVSDPPPTRWARAEGASELYGQHFAELVESGQDLDGEARLADALVRRHARILDAGAGMGRVAAALAARGHDVVGIEPDAALVAQARRTWPGVTFVRSDLLTYVAEEAFDLVVCVGNVMVFLAEGTERQALAAMRDLLAPEGRLLVGFHPTGAPAGAREYSPDEFSADAEATGLRVQHRFGSYELHPPQDEYAVWVLTAAG